MPLEKIYLASNTRLTKTWQHSRGLSSSTAPFGVSEDQNRAKKRVIHVLIFIF